VNVLSRRIGSVVAAAAVAFGLAAIAAPAASAAPAVTAPAVTATVKWNGVARGPWWCKPAHVGRDWQWDDGRRGGHWDHREWNRRTHRWEWRHQWRDDHYCAPRRFDGPPRRSDGPPANPQGPQGPRGPERGRS